MDVSGKAHLSHAGRLTIALDTQDGSKFAIRTKAGAIKKIKENRKSYKARTAVKYQNDPEGLAADVKAWTLRTQARH